MNERVVSRRGVYYDLSQSPYEYRTRYGDCFKFASEKKLEMYTRDIENELERLEKMIDRYIGRDFIPEDAYHVLRRSVYRSYYRNFEG